MNYNSETICALATAQGGALGIIRVSGPQSLSIVAALCPCLAGRNDAGSACPANVGSVCRNNIATKPQFPLLRHAHILSPSGEVIDEVMLSLFRAPHSYTGEDCVEISCHGSSYILNKVLELLVQNGCRMAYPGEYTQRAFLNGKMDLSQAEAVADLIASRNKATHQMAMSQLRGGISTELYKLRDQLLHLTTLLELELDFSDHEDLEFVNREELYNLAETIHTHISHLAHTFKTGQALKQGIPVAIVGKTNVGKSTLLNRLLHDDRAIVSDIHGTTRDTIEDTIDINGVQFRFIDTAGIRQTNNAIEKIGIERTYAAIERARIILWIFDAPPSKAEITDIIARSKGKELIPIQNKADLGTPRCNTIAQIPVLCISAKHDSDLSTLENAIYKAANIPALSDNDIIVTNTRHYESLCHAQEALSHVIEALKTNLSSELIAEDLRLVLSHLGEITGGTITSQETLNNIFTHFCVGK